MSCYIMHFEGQSLMWQGQSSKASHAILRQALLCPEKEKDDVIYSLEDKRPVRGGDPLLGASGDQPEHSERRCRKRRLSESSVFDIAAHGAKYKPTTPTEKMLFESAADLMQDDIHPEMESTSQLPTDNSEYTSHLLSQLSSSSLLPTMTSSQVSSVLSALEPNTTTQLPTLIPSTTNTPTKCPDHGNNPSTESHLQTDYIKLSNNTSVTIVQDLQSADTIHLDKTKKKRTFCLTGKAIIRYYTENRIKGNVWYQCSSCPFISVHKTTIVQHCVISHDGNFVSTKIGTSSGLQMYKCLACDNLFSNTHSLKVHYLYDHNSTNEEIEDLLKLSIEINKYLKGTNSGFAQIKPDVSTTGEKDIGITEPSSNCDDTVQQMQDHHPVEVINHSTAQFFPLFLRTKWRCPECHISCTSWNTVSSHLWREHGIDIELYSCDHCSYKTNSLTRLLNLHRRIHSEERPFLCDVCGKGFKTTKQLRNHKSWHKLKEKSKTEIAEKLVTCITCGRGFTCARLMRLHVQVVHKRLKPYLCYICGHSAANKSSLRSHLSLHTGLRPYSCDECDYTTRDHNNLRRHKMRHSGIKRYKCPLCPYSSIQASTYKTHILKKHPEQQDGLLYRCEICPFNTVKKENLLTHSARHEVLKTQDTNAN